MEDAQTLAAPSTPTETAPENVPVSETAVETVADPAAPETPTVPEAPAAPEAPVETAPEASEGTQSEEKPAETPAVAAPVVANGAQVQPVQVKNALSALHDDISGLVNKLKGSEIAAAHDVTDALVLLESTKTWIVDKLAQYDPALAASLNRL